VTRFRATKRSSAVVPFDRAAVWAVLIEPSLVARLTPMVRSIEADGDLWRWRLAPIEVLGRSIGLSFTEHMELTPQERIRYSHAPDGDERAGVEGTYTLADARAAGQDRGEGDGTRLGMVLEVHVDLPFPSLARPAVQASMHAVLATMGTGFAHQLERHLRSTT
jgi:carbon monoxide dehydrogenase subunit G